MKQDFSTKRSWSLFLYLTKCESLKVIKHPGFIVLTLICLSFLNSNFIGNVVNAEIIPTTGFFINQISVSEFPIYLITLFFVGEIVWRERHLNVSAIQDAYPIKNWVLYSSKITTVFLIQLLFAITMILFGVISQKLFFEYHDIQILLYLKVVLGLHLIYYWIATVAFFFLQLLASNKYIGFLFCGLSIILILIFPSIGLDYPLMRYGIMPEYHYSDISGLSPFSKSLVWHTVYWSLLAAFLFILSYKLWPRGVIQSKRKLLVNSLKFGSRYYMFTGVGLLVAFIGIGIFISTNRNENRLNAQRFATYEKHYQKFETMPMPSIQKIRINADLFPEEKRILMQGEYTLINKQKKPINTLLISLLQETAKLSFNRDCILIDYNTEALGTRIYKLNKPLENNETITFQFDYEQINNGFDAQNPNKDLIENGMLLTNASTQKFYYFPIIGYDRYSEIQDSVIRKNLGMQTKALGWKSNKDKNAAKFSQLDWINYEATISTSPSQTAITNGTLVANWQESNRNYYTYKTDTIITNSIAIISGRYEIMIKNTDSTTYNVYYHNAHSKNIKSMIDGHALSIMEGKKMGLKFPHKAMNVVEIPNYHQNFGTAFSMPTLTLWSEDGGFLSSQDKDSKQVNKVFSTALHEASHQWWSHSVKAAKAVEGGIVLNETMAQYSRLRGLERKYGREALNHFLMQERANYLYERSASAGEDPLIKSSQTYVAYNKGSLIINSISELIGVASLDMAIQNYYKEFAYNDSIYPVSKDLERHILKLSPDSLRTNISELFKKIILYDLGIESALVEKQPNSQYKIDLQVFAKKFEADPTGLETERAFSGFVPLYIFNKTEKLLHAENYPLKNGKLDLQILLDHQPALIVIDPNMVYLDKNIRNNEFKINTAL